MGMAQRVRNAIAAFQETMPRPDAGETSTGIAAASVLMGQPYRNPDELIGKKGIAILDKIKADEAVRSNLKILKRAILSDGWSIKPGRALEDAEKTQLDLNKEAAAFVEDNLIDLRGTFENSLRKMASFIDYGFSVTEANYWETDWRGRRAWMIRSLKSKKPHWLEFDMDEFDNILPDGLLQTIETTGDKVRLQYEKFVHLVGEDNWENPYGESVLTEVYPFTWLKEWVLKFTGIYAENKAGGIWVLKYPKNASPEVRATFERIISTVQARTAVAVSEGVEINVTEPSGRGGDFFIKLIQEINVYIARALGITDLLGYSVRPQGSQAAAREQKDVFSWVIKDYQQTIAAGLREQLFRPLINFNFLGAAIPELHFPPLTHMERVSLAKEFREQVKARILKPFPEDKIYLRETLGFPSDVVEEDEEIEEPPVPIPDDEPEEDIEDALRQEPPKDPDATFGKIVTSIRTYQMRRALLPFERKTNFQAILNTHDDAQEKAVADLSASIEKEFKNLIAYIKRHKIVENADTAALKKIPFSLADFQKKLRNLLVVTHLEGKQIAREELEKVLERSFALDDVSLARQYQELSPTGTTPREAVDFFKKKKLKIVPKEIAPYTRKAFEITGIISQSALSESKIIIEKAIRKKDLNWAIGQLERKMQGFLVDGQLAPPPGATAAQAKNILAQASAHRVETIVRTNVTEALNEGRRQMYVDPDVADFIAYFAYSAVIDDGTTAYCEGMDGKVFQKSELEREGFPPAHFNCRSMVIPVTTAERVSKVEGRIPGGIERAVGF